MNPAKVKRSQTAKLTDLPNIGPAMAQNLRLLGIERPGQLLGQSPYELYEQLCLLTATRHDPCALDVFISITRFMAGEDARPWWDYTAERKAALNNRNQTGNPMNFAETLATLPAIDHLAALELLDGATVVARIDNQPGKAGSLRVYHALYQEFGAIDALAADKGLRLFCEHTADAKARPGAHPNIDRLLQIIDSGQPLAVRMIAR